MPTPNPSLNNCYIPLPYNTSECSSQSKQNHHQQRSSGDGKSRTSKGLRTLCLHRSVLSSSSGSSLIELGHTKILCNVHGPRSIQASSHSTSTSGGVLNCSIRYAPFAKNLQTTMMISSSTLDGYINTNTHIPSSSSSGLSSEEIQLSSALYDAIIPSIPTHILQKSVIDVFCMVLSSDGPVLAPCIIASSLALVDCGVEVYDLVSACTVAIVSKSTTNSNDCDQDDSDGHNHNDNPLNNTDDTVLLLDPTEQETFQANGIITLAMMGSWKDVTCWNQTGKILPEVSMDAAELCRDGCGLMNKFMRQCLVGSLSL